MDDNRCFKTFEQASHFDIKFVKEGYDVNLVFSKVLCLENLVSWLVNMLSMIG